MEMKKGPLIMMLEALLLLSCPLPAQITPERLRGDPLLAMDVYRPYAYSPSKDTRPPKGYKAVYVSHYGRHGERFLIQEYYLRHGLEILEKEVLTPLGEKAKAEIAAMIERTEGNWGALSPRGAETHTAIAGRLFSRNKSVFRSGRIVRCTATPIPRCIVSMVSAAGTLATCSPRLNFVYRLNENFLCYMQPDEVRDHIKALRDSMFAAQPSAYDCLRACFSDRNVPSLKELAAVADALFFTWKDLPSLGLEQFDIRDFFSEQMLLHTARHYAAWDYCLLSRSPWWHREWLVPIFDDIVDRANEALERGDIAADLRFGHDSQLIPIYTALGLTARGPVRDYASSPDDWDPASICPMASNLQIEFYTKKNAPALVKVLLNECEVCLPDLSPIKGPYYLWEDFSSLLRGE